MILREKRAVIFPSKPIKADWGREIIAHSTRMVRPAQAIAWELGLTRVRVGRVGLAALLHDLGKFALPVSILQKPGPLNAEEWDLMRRHPGIGCCILQRLGGRWKSVARIVAAHHERWDGGGYPRGLTHEAIPLEARILSAVDAYDAMTSQRAYRSPLLHQEAREELRHGAGRQFDPRVVEAFLHVLDRQPYESLVLYGKWVRPEGMKQHIPASLRRLSAIKGNIS